MVISHTISVLNNDSSLRVQTGIERLDELLNIVSELVLGRNQLLQVNSEIAELHHVYRQIKKVVKNNQKTSVFPKLSNMEKLMVR